MWLLYNFFDQNIIKKQSFIYANLKVYIYYIPILHIYVLYTIIKDCCYVFVVHVKNTCT